LFFHSKISPPSQFFSLQAYNTPHLILFRYIFYLYALNTDLNLPADSNVKELKAAMKEHAIEIASLTGKFAAKDNP